MRYREIAVIELKKQVVFQLRPLDWDLLIWFPWVSCESLLKSLSSVFPLFPVCEMRKNTAWGYKKKPAGVCKEADKSINEFLSS